MMESVFVRYRKVPWLKDITESGSTFAKSEPEKRNIILTNGIALVSSVAVLALILAHRVFKSPMPSVRDWLYMGALLFLLPVYLNRKGLTTASRLAMSWIPPLFLMLVSYTSLKLKVHRWHRTSACVITCWHFAARSFQMFDVPRERIFLAGLAVPAILIIFFDPILNLLGVGYADYSGYDYAFNNVRAFVAMGVICVASYLLKSRADRNEELNNRLISELALKNEEMQRQASDRVHKLNRELYVRLQQLSEREFILNQLAANRASWKLGIHDQD
ncbi:MAG: hypothetical protein WDO15_16755 [Bacteroidota bacterium]